MTHAEKEIEHATVAFRIGMMFIQKITGCAAITFRCSGINDRDAVLP